MIQVLSALLALAAPEASGPAPDVSNGFAVLVSPPGDDAMAELIFRSAAELTAAGYTTRISPCAPRLQPGCPSPEGADAVALLAVIRFERIGAALLTELHILDGRGVRLRRRVGGEPGDDPATVAVHIVELLRASVLRATHGETGPPAESREIEPPPPPRPRPRLVMEPPAAAAPPPALSVAPSPPRREWQLWLALGAAVWQSTGGVGPALGPVFDARLGIGRWMLGLEVNVLPTAPQLSTGAFTTTVQQEIAVLQLARLFRLGPRLQLDAAAGAGIYHVSVQGRSSDGTVNAGSDSVLATAVVAGGTLAYDLGGALALFAGARVMVTQPSVGIAALGVQMATAGWPSLGVLAGARLEL